MEPGAGAAPASSGSGGGTGSGAARGQKAGPHDAGEAGPVSAESRSRPSGWSGAAGLLSEWVGAVAGALGEAGVAHNVLMAGPQAPLAPLQAKAKHTGKCLGASSARPTSSGEHIGSEGEKKDSTSEELESFESPGATAAASGSGSTSSTQGEGCDGTGGGSADAAAPAPAPGWQVEGSGWARAHIMLRKPQLGSDDTQARGMAVAVAEGVGLAIANRPDAADGSLVGWGDVGEAVERLLGEAALPASMVGEWAGKAAVLLELLK